ncbi:hypothetical protein QEZ54_20540 [Catellatospora sp. KI3]|uniref:hypothetical protein n=1 Tax=Catellatospora sp. KI3 TaxID=3041620 RepID=UPI00248226ED|nr:hypothetical protein [Catellatospora sp. KI3]MDI1463373.1 hypothetical protein [Catellatospora sp. KI3]
MQTEENTLAMRTGLTPEQRTADMQLTIDPGFVHHRLIQTVLPPEAIAVVDDRARALPSDMPDWMRRVRIDHLYMQMMLLFCERLPAPTLGDVLAGQSGTLFCSTVTLAAAPEVYERPRAVSKVITPGIDHPQVELHYSTSNIAADTTRSHLADGHDLAVVAKLRSHRDGVLIFEPLLMGSPWLSSKTGTDPFPGPEWYSHAFFENFIDDIDDFAAVRDVPTPSDFSVMRDISEAAFKQCLAEVLGDTARADWGGEMADHFAAHLRLGGRRTTAAFLLKGPANFAPMGLNHLGKNNDQIYRLAQTPAQLLVVQHCHEIQEPVRATLRAFAVQPGVGRRYCLIDGKDSLRLLIAYDKLDRARELSARP